MELLGVISLLTYEIFIAKITILRKKIIRQKLSKNVYIYLKTMFLTSIIFFVHSKLKFVHPIHPKIYVCTSIISFIHPKLVLYIQCIQKQYTSILYFVSYKSKSYFCAFKIYFVPPSLFLWYIQKIYLHIELVGLELTGVSGRVRVELFLIELEILSLNSKQIYLTSSLKKFTIKYP